MNDLKEPELGSAVIKLLCASPQRWVSCNVKLGDDKGLKKGEKKEVGRVEKLLISECKDNSFITLESFSNGTEPGRTCKT